MLIQPPLRAADASPGLFNWDPLLLPKTRRALARVRGNSGAMQVNFCGHSYFTGFGAGTGPGSNGAWPKSVPSVFQSALAKKDALLISRRDSLWPVQCTSGNSGITNYLAFDTRVAAGAGWSFTNVLLAPGGGYFTNTTDTTAFAFTPEGTWDTAVVYFIQGGSGGAGTVDIDGGATTAINYNGANAFTTVTKTTGAVGTHTCNIKRVSGIQFLVGIECYDSTKNDVRVRNLGWNGSGAANWHDTSFPWSPQSAFSVLAGDLTFLQLGTNDQNTSVESTVFSTNMQAIITAIKAQTDCILIRDHRGSVGVVNYYEDNAYQAVYRSLALTNGVPLIDVPARMDTYENTSGLGWYYSDNSHYAANGQSQESAWFADLISRL